MQQPTGAPEAGQASVRSACRRAAQPGAAEDRDVGGVDRRRLLAGYFQDLLRRDGRLPAAISAW
jgi:hypothetical protein